MQDDTLKTFQNAFLKALLDPAQSSQAFTHFIEASPALTASQHLAIYQHSYTARLEQCMAAQFGGLKLALGAPLFHLFCSEYLRTYPSNSYTLNNLGERFAEYLLTTRPTDIEEEEDWPSFIIELAQFEYLLTVLFDQPITDDYTEATVHLPEEQLVINPVSHLCKHQYPINQFFNNLKHNPKVDIPLPQPETCLVYRHRYKIGVLDLHNPIEIALVKTLNDGYSWKEAVKEVETTSLSTIKASWIELGILATRQDKL